MIARFLAWWDALDDEARADAHATALCVVVFLVHFTLWSWWYIEDAAITFAYARNAVAGDGLVAVAGGERIEGFSNPSWLFGLMFFQFLGISPFLAAKLMGAAFGAATLPLATAWARRTVGPGSPWPRFAALYLAISPQFVEWAASGLENSLFVLALTAAVIGVLREADRPTRVPVSALAMGVLAITRPEAPAYVGLVGLFGIVLHLANRSKRETAIWVAKVAALFLPPFLAWHAWRWTYFGWPFPNTYYAKLADAGKFDPWDWSGRGWYYVRRYFLETGIGFVLPPLFLGVGGVRPRYFWALVVGMALAVVLIVPGAVPIEGYNTTAAYKLVHRDAWGMARVAVLCGLWLTMAIGAGGRVGAAPRRVALIVGGFALFFAVFSGGDWMAGFRWMSMWVVPLAVLLADAAHTLVAWLDRRAFARLRWGLIGLVAGVPIAVGAGEGIALLGGPETMPYDVYRRVLYMQEVQRRLHLDHVTLLEVDMGAHLWWSGFDVVDMAGLVLVLHRRQVDATDIAMDADHRWQAGGEVKVGGLVLDTEGQQFGDVHADRPRSACILN